MLYSEKMPIFTAKRPAQTVTVDGAAYRYVRTFSGRDKTLVLLNGGMNTLEMWMDYVEPLSNMCGKSRSFWRGWSNGTGPCFAGADACIRPRVRLAVKTMNANQHSRCARAVQCSTGALIAARPRNASIDPYRRAIQSMRPNYSSFPSNIALVSVSPS